MIYKRGANWYLDVTIHGTRYRERLATVDRREALQLEKTRISEIEQGKRLAKQRSDIARLPFAEVAAQHLASQKGRVTERTLQFTRERLRALLPAFGKTPVHKIGADTIRLYQEARLEAGLSGRTINMEVGILRQILKRAKYWSRIADDVKAMPKSRIIVPRVMDAGTEVPVV